MTVYRVVFYIISSRFKIWWRFYVAMVKIAFCLELIKFGQIVKGSIFKLGKTKFDLCVLIWFLIFLLCRGVCDCWSIFNFLAVSNNFMLLLKILMVSASFLLFLFMASCCWQFASETMVVCVRRNGFCVYLNYERGFSKHKIHTWLYELLS